MASVYINSKGNLLRGFKRKLKIKFYILNIEKMQFEFHGTAFRMKLQRNEPPWHQVWYYQELPHPPPQPSFPGLFAVSPKFMHSASFVGNDDIF